MNRTRRTYRPFSLIELLFVMTFAAMVFSVFVSPTKKFFQKMRIQASLQYVQNVCNIAKRYAAAHEAQIEVILEQNLQREWVCYLHSKPPLPTLRKWTKPKVLSGIQHVYCVKEDSRLDRVKICYHGRIREKEGYIFLSSYGNKELSL